MTDNNTARTTTKTDCDSFEVTIDGVKLTERDFDTEIDDFDDFEAVCVGEPETRDGRTHCDVTLSNAETDAHEWSTETVTVEKYRVVLDVTGARVLDIRCVESDFYSRDCD